MHASRVHPEHNPDRYRFDGLVRIVQRIICGEQRGLRRILGVSHGLGPSRAIDIATRLRDRPSKHPALWPYAETPVPMVAQQSAADALPIHSRPPASLFATALMASSAARCHASEGIGAFSSSRFS